MTLVWVGLTLLAYRAALEIHRRSGSRPAANPMLISVTLVAAVLSLTGTSYETYFAGARLVHVLVGPATVALAIPLHAQIARLGTMLIPLAIALLVGSLTATASAVAIGWACGASPDVLLALAPKSVTMPIALGVAETIGAVSSLTALMVTLTGISGAIMADRLLDLTRTDDRAVRGFAVGLTAHAIGTGHVLREGEVAAGFAALAMGLNGLLTTLWLPLLAALLR
jgi:putative effector of murein hydrolase